MDIKIKPLTLRRREDRKRRSTLFWGVVGVVVFVGVGVVLSNIFQKTKPGVIDTGEVAGRSFEKPPTNEPDPVSADFGLIIPRLGINVPIIKDVNGQSKEEYFKKLEHGIAHYQGTALPGQIGNTFLFGHSSFLENASGDYKTVFEHLDKVEPGDQIFVYYEGNKYEYRVNEELIVEPTEMSILDSHGLKELTIMTCWPAGTIEKRYVVKTELIEKS